MIFCVLTNVKCLKRSRTQHADLNGLLLEVQLVQQEHVPIAVTRLLRVQIDLIWPHKGLHYEAVISKSLKKIPIY